MKLLPRKLRSVSLTILLLASALRSFAQPPATPELPAMAPPTAGNLPAQPSGPIPKTGPIMTGLRVFTVGHSFHAWVGSILAGVAAQAGIKDHKWQIMSLGGSQVEECWEIPNVKGRVPSPKIPKENTAKEALAAGRVDVLTLSPIWMPDPGIEKFTRLGLQGNPNIRVTVQEYWLPNDVYEPKYPLDIHKKPAVNHDAATVEQLTKAYEGYNHDVEAYVAGINKSIGKKVILIVPVGMATLELRKRIIAGEVPVIKKQSELYRDPWGHPTPPLQVLSVYCHYAVIYRRSPVGLPIPKNLVAPYADPKLNLMLQQIAWDTVTHHPMTGLTPAN